MNPFGQESIAHTYNSRLGDQVYIAEFKMNRTNKKIGMYRINQVIFGSRQIVCIRLIRLYLVDN